MVRVQLFGSNTDWRLVPASEWLLAERCVACLAGDGKRSWPGVPMFRFEHAKESPSASSSAPDDAEAEDNQDQNDSSSSDPNLSVEGQRSLIKPVRIHRSNGRWFCDIDVVSREDSSFCRDEGTRLWLLFASSLKNSNDCTMLVTDSAILLVVGC